MSVEELIEKLKAQPYHYEVKVFQEGIEIPDWSGDISRVDIDVLTKEILLQIDNAKMIKPL